MSIKELSAMLTHLSDQLASVAAAVRKLEAEERGAKVRRNDRTLCRIPDGQLPRRQAQVLAALLDGLAEKQVARKLGISQHTVHVYVKALHKRFGVASRSELLISFLSHKPAGNVAKPDRVGDP